MDKKKYTIATIATTSSSDATKSANHYDMLTQPAHRVLQNFVMVWLDANLNEDKKDFKLSLQRLRQIVSFITTFTDVQECIDYISKLKEEKVFMIVSGSLGRKIIPDIVSWPQLDSIYIFCENKSFHEQWAAQIAKVKGVHTKIESICAELQIDCKSCDRNMISISFNGIDPLFMYTQLLKETLLDIEDDDTRSIKELAEYCRLQDDIPEQQIDQIEREYRNHSPIWWYTADFFIYSMLNRGLRLMDVDIILKMGFFIRHLHHRIETLHKEQQCSMITTTPFQVFRGQGLSIEDFGKMKKTEHGFMSFNNFLSTSRDRSTALNDFASRAIISDSSTVGILFVMNIDPKLRATASIPYADVSTESYFKNQEQEILFSTHTIFRIDHIERIQYDQTNRLWQVNLTLMGNKDHELDELTSHIRQEVKVASGWSRLGEILIKLGQFEKAKYLYHIHPALK
ncbi:unnamed protein product [Rotaria magnacalcarata]